MKSFIFALCATVLCTSLYGQVKADKYLKDVESIDAIIDAYYDVVSGSANEPWEFERDKYLHNPNALIVKIGSNGKVDVHSLEAEYIPILSQPREASYEIELNRKIDRYENMAQVWSTFEIRSDPDVESDVRGIATIILYFAEERWWIASWIGQPETENPIPHKYLGK